MKAVVDTNVAIAANGRDTHANVGCQLACIEFLQELLGPRSRHQLFIDDRELILDEYRDHLNYHGEPGVGDLFYKFLHDHMYSESKVKRISITPLDDEARGFEELPPNPVDKSDRKFLAVAVAAEAIVCNALDTDWHEETGFLDQLGIKVRQLCPEHGCSAPCI